MPTPNETIAPPDEMTTAADDATEVELPRDLGELVGQLATDLRDGKLTPQQAADQLEQFRDRHEPAEPKPETTTEIVRETDGYRYEKGTPKEIPEQVESEELSKLTELRRIAWRRGEDIDDALDQGADHAFEVVESIRPTAAEQRQPIEIPHYDQPRQGVDAGDAATAAMVVALLTVEAVRMGAHRLSTRGRKSA